MDDVDRNILAELQRDGRSTVTQLAELVRLSVSQCHRRLRELERTKVVVGYRARLDPASIDLGFEAIVFVTMAAAQRAVLDEFDLAVAAHPQIVQAQRLFGDPDYLLRVVAADLTGFQRLYDEHLSTLPGVRHLRSTLVMKNVADKPLPV